MKNFLLIGLLLSLQVNFAAVSVDNLKHDSQAFCEVIEHNKLHITLSKQLIFDCAKLVALIKEMLTQIEDVAMIQAISGTPYTFEQFMVINKHIMSLSKVRIALMQTQNKHQLSDELMRIFNFYRNSIDVHYYRLNPSYESYLLKQCNVSLKNTQYVSMYTAGSWIACSASVVIRDSYLIAKSENASSARWGKNPEFSSVFFNGLIAAGIGCIATTSFLAYCAYKKINDPEYEYALLAQE